MSSFTVTKGGCYKSLAYQSFSYGIYAFSALISETILELWFMWYFFIDLFGAVDLKQTAHREADWIRTWRVSGSQAQRLLNSTHVHVFRA